jgi:hypothetical protein
MLGSMEAVVVVVVQHVVLLPRQGSLVLHWDRI